MKTIFVILLVGASAAQAETFVCATEAVSGASNNSEGEIWASTYSDNRTLLYTQVDGQWVVKPSGSDHVLFDDCEGVICQRSDSFAGTFLMDKETQIFSVTWIGVSEGVETWLVGKGRCTRI